MRKKLGRYGAHMKMLVNNGLNVRALEDIVASMVNLRAFNCVRLPYSSSRIARVLRRFQLFSTVFELFLNCFEAWTH